MRQSLILTCLLLTAWTEPAGIFAKRDLPETTAGFSVVEKSTTGQAVEDDDFFVGPAETTTQLTKFDDSAIAIAPLPTETFKYISGDSLAALDAVADEFGLTPAQPVPVPPHRAVPHAQVCEALADAAANNDLPTPFFIRLIWQESGFKQNIVSRAGAQGVAQFMPETAAQRGLADPFNPLQAVRASAQLLRDLFQQFGNLGLAAAAYNAGPRRVQDWLTKKGKLPQETRDYVERITGKKADEWRAKTATANPLRVPARAPCQKEAGLYASNGPAAVPLPPSLPKANQDITASIKQAPAVTKTVSAKSADKRKVAAKAKPKSVETKDTSKSSKLASQTTGKTTGKLHSKKVKVADAEARH